MARIGSAANAPLIGVFDFVAHLVWSLLLFNPGTRDTIFRDCIVWSVSDMVGTPNCCFSRATALFFLSLQIDMIMFIHL